MVLNKRGLFIGLFLIILSIGIVSASTCSIVPRTSCDAENIVMGLSAQTNAHGQLATQTTYDYVLCCDFGSTTDCSPTGTNRLVRLSSATNAHAEVPSGTAYTGNDVCYGDFVFSSSLEGGACSVGQTEILSLSSSTNAHIGSPGDYPFKICYNMGCAPDCEAGRECGPAPNGCGDLDQCGVCDTGEDCSAGICVPSVLNAYWSSTSGNPISEIYFNPTGTNVLLNLINTGVGPEVSYDFKIYERDNRLLGLAENDLIETLTGITDSSGNIAISWEITQNDLDTYEDTFYFEAGGVESSDLFVNLADYVDQCFFNQISVCSQYGKDDCNNDPCGVGEASLPQGTVCGVSDGLYIYTCGCKWYGDGDNEGCGPHRYFEPDEEESSPPYSEGDCEYEWSSTNCVNEGDLFTYTVKGIGVAWSEDTLSYDNDPNDIRFVQDNRDNRWYFDEDRKLEECLNSIETTSIPCPAELQLPFFGTFGVIGAVIIAALIYYFFFIKKDKNKKPQRKKRK